MKAFQFPLEKILAWRKTELDLAEANYRKHLSVLANLDQEKADLQAAGSSAESTVRSWNPVAGAELDALGTFRLHTRFREMELAKPRAECQRRIAAQQAVMLEARRRLRLLERLKERRLAEWKEANNHELEELASESFLANWKRRL